ncbi:MAG: hypothetical protein ACYDH4_08545 [Candidatus Cryosericum sp.]
MNKRILWSRILSIAGLAMIPTGVVAYVFNSRTPPYSSWLSPGMIAVGTVVYIFNGMFDPACRWMLLTGLILPASGLAALGACLARSHYRKLLYAALVLTVCGLIAGFGVFIVKFNDSFDVPNPWWALVTYAYPIGWIISLVGAALVIVQSFRRPPVSRDNVENGAALPPA